MPTETGPGIVAEPTDGTIDMSGKAVNAATVKAHFVGGGIGSLAAAAFLIRDGKIPGEHISIYEAMSVLGGALDGAGNAIDGYRLLRFPGWLVRREPEYVAGKILRALCKAGYAGYPR